MEILTTKDYNQFKFLKSNREILIPHVNKIKLSILKKNLLKNNPIIVNKEMEVVDGQHRLQAAKELDVEIYYLVSDQVTNEDISTLNTNKLNWKLEDYLNFWYSEGKAEYKKVSHFVNNNPKIPLTGSLLLLGADYRGVISEFKDGTFQVSNQKEAELLAAQLDELSQYGKHVYSTTFLRQFARIVKIDKYDHKKLIYQIEKQPKSFVPCINEKQYLELFDEIYNRDIPTKNRLSFRK